MASSETPPPSIRQGVRIVPADSSTTVEVVLLAVGEQVGHDKIVYASRMNRAVVVFLKEVPHVNQLIESGVFIGDTFVQVSPLSVPSTRITVSGVPPFIPNELLEQELRRFGKMASGFKTVSLGCRDPKLKHVQSLRRQVFMFLSSPAQTLDVSFRVKHGEGLYMVYASSGSLKCFECGDVGHKRFACPHRQQGADSSGGEAGSARAGPPAAAPVAGSALGDAAAVSFGGPAAGGSGAGADGPLAEGAVSVCGVTGTAACATVSPSEKLDGEKMSQSEEQQVSVAAESLDAGCGESRSADCGESQSGPAVDPADTVVTGSAGGDQTAISCEGRSVCSSQVSCEDDMEYDSESDTSEPVVRNTDVYSLEEMNGFLDATFKRSVKVTDYFSDTEKFIRSVNVLKNRVGFDLLDEKKRFRLKKHITTLRKAAKGKTAQKSKK